MKMSLIFMTKALGQIFLLGTAVPTSKVRHFLKNLPGIFKPKQKNKLNTVQKLSQSVQVLSLGKLLEGVNKLQVVSLDKL